jgi:hypothetical protein
MSEPGAGTEKLILLFDCSVSSAEQAGFYITEIIWCFRRRQRNYIAIDQGVRSGIVGLSRQLAILPNNPV